MAYSAIVTRIRTRPHPNADRLLLGTCLGHQVIVSKDTPDGSLGVYFDTDGQLSEEYCTANDLIGYTDPETGERKGGFFTSRRNVRAQSFRGEHSYGFWMPLSSLSFTGCNLTSLQEGTMFSQLNGIPICKKFVTQGSIKKRDTGNLGAANKRLVSYPTFPQHLDTEQFQHHAEWIQSGSLLYFTEKLHGTSGRYGRVAVEVPLKKTLPQRLIERLSRKKIAFPESDVVYQYINGTRRMVLDHVYEGYYGSEEFRAKAVMGITLHKGEILYFELVGYTETGMPIMPPHKTAALKDRTFSFEYGEIMAYKYGCPERECRLYLYRIAQVNEDGHLTELSWSQVQRRARELGLEVVPTVYEPMLYNGNVEELRTLVNDISGGESNLDHTHIREGVCVRCESPDGTIKFYKNKSFEFKVMEGIAKEDESYVDAEEVQ